jgi:hypothetical protein
MVSLFFFFFMLNVVDSEAIVSFTGVASRAKIVPEIFAVATLQACT